eukprot:jgi/Chlat1/5556/Chrsp369S00412
MEGFDLQGREEEEEEAVRVEEQRERVKQLDKELLRYGLLVNPCSLVQVLEVTAAELASLKPGRRAYEKFGGVFFARDVKALRASVRDEMATKKSERDGLKLGAPLP